MFRQVITAFMLACFLLQINCATTKVPVASRDYDTLREEKTIFVTTKRGIEHELVNFEITNTHIHGMLIGEGLEKNTSAEETITIALEDVEFITVKESKSTLGFLSQGLLIGFGIGAAAILAITYAIVSANR